MAAPGKPRHRGRGPEGGGKVNIVFSQAKEVGEGTTGCTGKSISGGGKSKYKVSDSKTTTEAQTDRQPQKHTQSHPQRDTPGEQGGLANAWTPTHSLSHGYGQLSQGQTERTSTNPLPYWGHDNPSFHCGEEVDANAGASVLVDRSCSLQPPPQPHQGSLECEGVMGELVLTLEPSEGHQRVRGRGLGRRLGPGPASDAAHP